MRAFPADPHQVKRMTDDEWVARTRARVASGGGWQTPEEELAAVEPAEPAAPGTACVLACPLCGGPNELHRFDADGTPDGSWRYCQHCDGVWVTRSGLGFPLELTDDAPDAFLTRSGPVSARNRCSSCSGYVGPGGTCSDCGRAAPPLKCPSCAINMGRTESGGVTLDICPTCGGTWFDVGEVATVYGLKPEPDIATKVARMTSRGRYGFTPMRGGSSLLDLVVGLTRNILC